MIIVISQQLYTTYLYEVIVHHYKSFFKMKSNMGSVDRIIRVVIAAIIVVLYYKGAITGTLGVVLLLLAVVFALTSTLGICPLYVLFGITSCLIKEKNKIMKKLTQTKRTAMVLILLPLMAQAQVTIEWSNEPGGVAVAVDQTNHVYSANWDYNPAGDITLTKRNSNGIVLWSTSYDNLDNTRHEVVTWIATDSQNNCLVAGTIRSGFSNPVDAASVLMKFDTNGNLLWRTVFESTFEGSYTKKILVDNNDNIYVLGLGMGSNGLVTRVKKFDTSGIPIWTFYDSNGIGAPINMKLTSDNALLVVGRGITGIMNGYLKISVDGNLIWNKPGITSPTIGDAAGDSLGNTYIINGENTVSNAGSILEKYDPSGILIWSNTNAMAGSKVETGSDDNPIISGFPNAGTAGAAFMKYDSGGSVLWQNLNADGAEILLLHGQLLLDNLNNAYLSAGNLFNMAVCKINSDGTNGWVGLVSGSNSAKSFVLDANNGAYIIGTTTAKLAETALEVNTPSKVNFIVNPNPFDNYFTIKMQENSGEKKVTLFSITGTKVYESHFWGQTENIDDLKIDSGLYLLTVTDQNGIVSKQKMVRK